MSTTRLARKRSFRALHLYKTEDWSDAENERVYGACFTPNGHGHDYTVEAFLEGRIDPVTGMILNLVDIDRVMGEVLTPLNDKHLNRDVDEFTGKVPTTEVLATFIHQRLLDRFSALQVKLVKTRVYEYEDLWVDVWS